MPRERLARLIVARIFEIESVLAVLCELSRFSLSRRSHRLRRMIDMGSEPLGLFLIH